jgi:hypothetical protein
VFVGHNFETFVEVTVDMLNKHTVVIAARENVAINLKEVNHLLENAKELAGSVP